METLKGKRVLVSGGCGFIGSHVVDALLDQHAKVTVVDDLSTGNLVNIKHHANHALITFHCTDFGTLDAEYLKKFDYVIHLAALANVNESWDNPLKYELDNVGKSLKLMLECKKAGVKKFFMASSSAIYGDGDMKCLSPYALNKKVMEEYMEFYGTEEFQTLAFRFYNVFGPRQKVGGAYASVIPNFMTQGLQGKDLTIYGDGLQTRDFIYVKDVARTILRELSKMYNSTYHIDVASGKSISVNTLALLTNNLFDNHVNVVYKEARKGEPRDSLSIANCGYTDFNEAMKETYEYYKEYYG